MIEEPRFRGPGAPKALPDQLTLEAEIDYTIAFLDACFGKKPTRQHRPQPLGSCPLQALAHS